MTMPAQVLQCPFCDTTSSRGTGLTAHIRLRHPKEYAKWIKDPNRLQAARTPASQRKAAKSARAVTGPAVCPECGKTFKNRGALGGHMTYIHKAVEKGAKVAEPQLPAPPQPAAWSPTLTSAHEHLRAAREALVGRDQH